jgi:hypothetical protein
VEKGVILILFLLVGLITKVNPLVAQFDIDSLQNTAYFGYGISYKLEGRTFVLPKKYNQYEVVIYPRCSWIRSADVNIQTTLFTPDSLKHFNHRNVAPLTTIKAGIRADSVHVEQIKSLSTDDFELKLFEVLEINYKKRNKGKSSKGMKRNKWWLLTCDTIFNNAIHVKIWSKNDSRIMGKRALRGMKNLHLEPLDRFPSFDLEMKSDSGFWNHSVEYVNSERDLLVNLLPCMDRASIYQQYSKIHIADLDSLLDNFLYVEYADSIYSREYQRLKDRYLKGNAYLQEHYKEIGNISVDRIFHIYENLLDMKYGLDQFQNFLNKNNVSTVFDTLAWLKARFTVFYDKVCLSELESRTIYDHLSLQSNFEAESMLKIYEDQASNYMNVENDMFQLIHRHYLKGDGYVFGRRHLLDLPNKDVYVFDPVDSALIGNILVTLTEYSPGMWQVQLDTISLGFDANMLSDMVPLNNKLMFKMREDYIILDTTQTPFTFQKIDNFPDSLFEYTFVCNVKSSLELYTGTILNVIDNRPSEYSFVGPGLRGNRTARNEFLQSVYHPKNFVYLHKDINDINGDGLLDIYSFAVVNGQMLFSKCYVERQGMFVELDMAECIGLIGNLNLYKNVMTYSAMGSMNEKVKLLND